MYCAYLIQSPATSAFGDTYPREGCVAMFLSIFVCPPINEDTNMVLCCGPELVSWRLLTSN